MTDPRQFNDQASEPSGDEQIEQIEQIDPRVDNPDEVKGGRRNAGDPGDGSEVSPRLG